jgi:hypothetical protein
MTFENVHILRQMESILQIDDKNILATLKKHSYF